MQNGNTKNDFTGGGGGCVLAVGWGGWGVVLTLGTSESIQLKAKQTVHSFALCQSSCFP